MSIHKHLLYTSTIASVLRPTFEYYICPNLKGYSNKIDTICDTITLATAVAPVAIGSYLAFNGLSQQHNLQSLALDIKSNALKLVLPAGLGMITAQLHINDKGIPLSAFAIGTVKSSFEISTIGAVMKTINPEGALGDLSIFGYTTTNAVAYGGLVSVAVAASTNTINYIVTSLIQGKEFDREMLSNATDYALGYSVARPLYQIGTHFLHNEEKLVGTACMFSAPIFRGYTLGALGKGSVTVPGSNDGVMSNVIDGGAIATASLTRSYLEKHFPTKSGYIVTGFLLSTIAADKIVDHYDNITEATPSSSTQLVGYLPSNQPGEEL